MRLALLVAALSLLATLPVAASATDVANCPTLLAQHLVTDLTLSFDQFDQDDHQGWRPLGDAGCEAEAAFLIASYAEKHPHPVLTWHRAQMLAKAGNASDAIEAARLTLRPPHSDEGSDFDWNDYANATIAFLQGDKASLQSNRDRLADAAAKAEFNQPNLRSADKLLRCFGQPYKIAYSCPTAQ